MITIIVGVKDRVDKIDINYGRLGTNEIDVFSYNNDFFDKYGLVVGLRISLAIEHTPMNNKYTIFRDCVIKSLVVGTNMVMFTLGYGDIDNNVDGNRLYRRVKLERINGL